jgi:hypothetical protein
MKIAMPRSQVQRRVLVLVFARFCTHSPKANEPPARSMRAMRLPMRPQTRKSQAMSSLRSTVIRASLNAAKKSPR